MPRRNHKSRSIGYWLRQMLINGLDDRATLTELKFKGKPRGEVMKRVLFGLSLLLALGLPVLAQDKEQDRVENAGTVMKEILAAPDSIPQSVLDKADCV